MIRYQISSGVLTRDGAFLGIGYSGQPDYQKPEFCDVKCKGPIPPGRYDIGAPVDTVTHGPYVLPLTPDPKNEMYGRSGFLIHGDSVVHPGTASEGCIVVHRVVRESIHASADINLEVVP